MSLVSFLAIFVLAIASAESVGVPNENFPRFSFHDHPLYTLPLFTEHEKYQPPAPVIVKEYHYTTGGMQRVHGAIFVPRFATYRQHRNGTDFFGGLDALIVPNTLADSSNAQSHLSVSLNAPARAFAILSVRGMDADALQNGVNVSGAPRGWGVPTVAVSAAEQLQFTKSGIVYSLPHVAVCMEVPVDPHSPTTTLPHPSTIRVNNRAMTGMSVVFALNITAEIKPFPEPALPDPFTAPLGTDNVMDERDVQPLLDPPVPNSYCPKWLHDLCVTPASWNGRRNGEPTHWSTWHPIVDPIYWCYFAHEHGSYPGHYRPKFGLTAWKTCSPLSDTKRQLESHNGFKVFSFPVTASRAVIITVHMHLLSPRWFTIRKHTVIFAVCGMKSAGEWELEMELHMKMDFGSAKVTYSNRTTVPLDWAVQGDVEEKRVQAGRRMNVMDLSEYPRNIDRRLLYTRNTFRDVDLRAISHGIYEVWRGPLNTCSSSRSAMKNKGFSFDVRDPATAIRNTQDLVHMQQLTGKSINRVLSVGRGGVQIGIRHCHFNLFNSKAVINLAQTHGVFFTDANFDRVMDGSGLWNLRQFIKDDFQELDIPHGQYSPIRLWNSWMQIDETGQVGRRSQDIERAVVALEN